MEVALEWNVYWYNFNGSIQDRKVEIFNVFDHGTFYKEVLNLFIETNDKRTFSKKLDSLVFYYFWSKSEYEVRISGLFDDSGERKIDIYSQLKLNWDKFIDYLWFKKLKLKNKVF